MSDVYRFIFFCMNMQLLFMSLFYDIGKVYFGELRIYDGVNYIFVKFYIELDYKILFVYVLRYVFS